MESRSSLSSVIESIKNKYSDEAVHTAFSLYLKMINNIIKNPNEPKFRTFKLTNEAIKTKILIIQEMLVLVRESGFTDVDSEHLAYKHPKVDSLNQAAALMTQVVAEIDERNRLKEVAKKNVVSSQLNDEINAKLREEQKKKKEILQQLEYDRLERAKREKVKDSVANDLKYGATLKKFECKDQKG